MTDIIQKGFSMTSVRKSKKICRKAEKELSDAGIDVMDLFGKTSKTIQEVYGLKIMLAFDNYIKHSNIPNKKRPVIPHFQEENEFEQKEDLEYFIKNTPLLGCPYIYYSYSDEAYDIQIKVCELRYPGQCRVGVNHQQECWEKFFAILR
ncbi:MAG: hypothetical protein LBF37_00580 [Rickettsiales bacterium]|nr:hypothetical protein [Rickettsiales bacterium]